MKAVIAALIITIQAATSPAYAEKVKKIETIDIGSIPDDDIAKMAWFLQSGSGKIDGQAFLRQRGGGVVRAAGEVVYLTPSVGYFLLRSLSFELVELYILNHTKFKIVGGDKREDQYIQATKADADGRFSFSGLPDGRYFISTRVVWFVGKSLQGGYVKAYADVRGGNSVTVIVDSQ